MTEQNINSDYKYSAFISYSHKNAKRAKWLKRKIETYKLPTVSSKENSNLPKRIDPVFLDTDDITVLTPDLNDTLREYLRKSQYLIVICSPEVTSSEYVGQEISYFIDMGRADRIVPVIIDGIPNSQDPSQECFHPVLKQRLPNIFGININEIGKELAYVKVIAKLLNLDVDTLWQRHKRRMLKQRILKSALALLIAAMMAGVRAYYQPFDIRLTLNETGAHNENLGFPTKNGEITIIFNNDKDTLTSEITSLNDTITFQNNNIPGKCRNKNSKLRFELHGFFNADTIIRLSPKVTLPIKRDEDIYGEIIGYVYDGIRTPDIPLEGATVRIAGEEKVTDSNGYFKINIPLERQRRAYDATVVFNGKEQRAQTAYPTEKQSAHLNRLYVEEK
jgi:hypothetical protein